MSQINVATLHQLANLKLATLAASMGATTGLPADLQQAINKVQADRTKEITEAAAVEILNTVQNVDNFIAGLAKQVIDLDNQKTAITALAENVKKAKAYGYQTQNFLPALKAIGEPLPGIAKDLTLVPKDWVAEVAAAPAVAATQETAAV